MHYQIRISSVESELREEEISCDVDRKRGTYGINDSLVTS